MCFSATASFTAGAVLLGLGVVSLRSVPTPRQIPFAAIPLLFAIQQLSEGVVWLTFRYGAPQLGAIAVHIYVLFAFVLWPAYVPWTAWLVEPAGPRRRLLSATVVVGTGVAAWLMAALVLHPVVAVVSRHHLQYLSAPFLGIGATALYLVATTASLLLSSRPKVRAFGILVLVAFAAAYGFYATWFISVWCFFAGIVSAAVCLQLSIQSRGGFSSVIGMRQPRKISWA